MTRDIMKRDTCATLTLAATVLLLPLLPLLLMLPWSLLPPLPPRFVASPP